MDCEEVREVLLCGGDDKADDGARSLEEVRAGVERHLAECAECRSLAAAAESFRAWMIGRGRAFEPPGFRERLVAAAVAETAGTVPARERTPRGGEGPGGAARRGLRAMAMAAAASAALAVGAWAALHAWISSREGAREGVAGESCWCFVNGDGGNSRNAGEAAEEMRRILWRAEVPGMAGAYKPLAWRNYIIVGSVETAWNEGCRFVAFDAETGAKRWECTFHEGDFYKGRDFPDRCIVDGVLYASDGRHCVAVDARTGAFLKAYRPPVGASGWTYLAADEHGLYGTSAEGASMFRVDILTGNETWMRAGEGETFVPAMSGDRIFAYFQRGRVLAIERGTGRPVWRSETGATGRRGRVLAGCGTIVCQTESDELIALNALDGSIMWKRALPGAWASSVAIGNEALYLSLGMAAVRLSDGAIIRRADMGGWTCSPPTVYRSGALAVLRDRGGTLAALDPQKAGSVRRILDDVGRSCDGAIVAGGRMYFVAGSRLTALGN